MPDESTWSYDETDLDDIETRLALICLSTELTAWDAATDPTKDILLTRAVEKLDNQCWRGQKYLRTQDELFPRTDDVGSYDYDETTAEYEVPQQVIDAIALEAVAILADSGGDYDDYKIARDAGAKSVQISGTGLQVELADKAPTDRRGGFLSDRAWRLLGRYLARDVCAL